MLVTPSPKVKLVNFAQLFNASLGISPFVIFRLFIFAKTFENSDKYSADVVMLFKPLQPLNALFPMLVTLSGIVMLVKPLQP